MLIALSLLFPAAHAAEVLPVTRIRFYETGVAWFEREGVVSNTTSLPVPTSHLDDAIKTLVVLGGDVDLGAIRFPTALGDDAARVNAGLGADQQLGFTEALSALLGAQLSLKTPDGTVSGVLIDIDGPVQIVAATQGSRSERLASEYALTLLDAKGTLHRTTTDRVTEIRSEQAEVTDRLLAAARTLSPTRAQRPSSVNVQLAHGGRLGLGYLTETPVWRVSYRILDRSDGEAELQAWALIHNDTDEPWKRVQLELANGEPDSFLYPLAAPRYAARELINPSPNLGTVSQLGTDTVDGLMSGGIAGLIGGGVSGSGYGSGGSGYGSGSMGTGTIGSASLKTAEPVETPTQFVYRVPKPIDLPAHHSALVPLVQEGVETEPVVAFDPSSNRARSGMWLRNSTEQTLPAGVLSVLQSGGLAGEAQLERLKPGETQLVSFGNELDLDIALDSDSGERQITGLKLLHKRLQLQLTLPTHHNIELRNRSGRERDVWVALSLGPTEELIGDLRTEIDPHRGWTWVVLPTEPGEHQTHLTSERQSRSSLSPEEVAPQTWRDWAEQELADPAALLSAAELREELDRIHGIRTALNAERSRAEAELTGLRETLTATNGSDAAHPVVRRATVIESELRRLDSKLADLETRREEAVDKLHRALAPLADPLAMLP